MTDTSIWSAVRHPERGYSSWPTEMALPVPYEVVGFLGTRAEVDAFCEGRCVRDNADWRVARSYWNGRLTVSLYIGPHLESEIWLAAWARPEREGWDLYLNGDREFICGYIRRMANSQDWLARVEKLFDAFEKGQAA